MAKRGADSELVRVGDAYAVSESDNNIIPCRNVPGRSTMFKLRRTLEEGTPTTTSETSGHKDGAA
jgi:hypothetical protein